MEKSSLEAAPSSPTSPNGFVLSVNDGRMRLTAEPGETILDAFGRASLYIPSACGGQGTCGSCSCRVKQELGPLSPFEIPRITESERKTRHRLACQVRVDRDLDVSIPEEYFDVRRVQARVESLRDLGGELRELALRLISGRLDFTPGQHVQMTIPPYDRMPERVQRAYSIASPPGEGDRLELLVRRIPRGIATTWIHRSLQVGDQVDLAGPFGRFALRKSAAIKLCVAGGSGIAPFMSMFRHLKRSGEATGAELWCFLWGRTVGDLIYVDELRAFGDELPGFHFVPVVSERRREDEWAGETGDITEALERHLGSGRIPASACEGYICGSPGLVNACRSVLARMAVPDERIFMDKFV